MTRRPVVVYAVLLIFIYFLPFRRTRPFNPFADVRHHACGPARSDVISFVLTRSATGATRFRARKTQNNRFSFIVFSFFHPFSRLPYGQPLNDPTTNTRILTPCSRPRASAVPGHSNAMRFKRRSFYYQHVVSL